MGSLGSRVDAEGKALRPAVILDGVPRERQLRWSPPNAPLEIVLRAMARAGDDALDGWSNRAALMGALHRQRVESPLTIADDENGCTVEAGHRGRRDFAASVVSVETSTVVSNSGGGRATGRSPGPWRLATRRAASARNSRRDLTPGLTSERDARSSAADTFRLSPARPPCARRDRSPKRRPIRDC